MSYASKRRRDSGGDDEGGGANWMDTYGDLVTLLLCFFVLLFAFSSTDSEKWEALVAALSGTPSISIQALDPATVMEPAIPLLPNTAAAEADASPDLPDIPDEFNSTQEVFFELHSRMQLFVEEHGLSATVYADYDAFILIIRFDDSIFFNSGDASLLPDALPVLDKMADFFEENVELYEMIRIEGHTDNVPINTSKYPSNWELSFARAGSAISYFWESGRIDVTKLSGTGYSEYHPIDTNDTAEGRAANRRVDFVIEGIKS